MIQIISDKIVKIRKPHYCFGCHRKFEPGSVMDCQTNKYDGTIGKVYSCATCRELMRKFKSLFFDDGEYIFPDECVAVVCRDYRVGTPEELLQKLTDEHRRIH